MQRYQLQMDLFIARGRPDQREDSTPPLAEDIVKREFDRVTKHDAFVWLRSFDKRGANAAI